MVVRALSAGERRQSSGFGAILGEQGPYGFSGSSRWSQGFAGESGAAFLGTFGPVAVSATPVFTRPRSVFPTHYREAEVKKRSAFELGTDGRYFTLPIGSDGNFVEGSNTSGVWSEKRLGRFDPNNTNSHSQTECDAGGRWAHVCTSPKALPDGIVPDPYV